MAFAPALIEAAPYIASGATAAMTALEHAEKFGRVLDTAKKIEDIGAKYVPGVKRSANFLSNISSHVGTAKDYLKKSFTTGYGFKKMITKDIPKRLGQASSYIASGKFVKGVSGVADDARNVLSAVESVSGKNPHLDRIKSVVDTAEGEAKRHHDTISKYNKSAVDGIQSFKDRYQ